MFTRLGRLTFRRRRLVIVVWGALHPARRARGHGCLLVAHLRRRSRSPLRVAACGPTICSLGAGDDDGHIYAVAQGARPTDVAAAAAAVRKLPGVAHVQDGIRRVTAGRPRSTSPLPKGRATRSGPRPSTPRDRLQRVPARRVVVGGDLLQDDEFATQSQKDLQRGEAVALPVALAAMIVIFGGVMAAGVPLPHRAHRVVGAFHLPAHHHRAGRRLGVRRQRRHHVRSRPRHRLRPPDGEPLPRGAQGRPRHRARGRAHRRYRRGDRRCSRRCTGRGGALRPVRARRTRRCTPSPPAASAWCSPPWPPP